MSSNHTTRWYRDNEVTDGVASWVTDGGVEWTDIEGEPIGKPIFPEPQSDNLVLRRIADALERIADVLEME